MTKCRGIEFEDEDQAHEYFRQPEIDDAAEALRAEEEAARRRAAPIPQPCHECGHRYAGIVCPLCKEERPAWTAMKNITAKQQAPLPWCRYFPNSLCSCGLRGTCLPAA